MRHWSGGSGTAQATTRGQCPVAVFPARDNDVQWCDGVMCTGMTWRGVSGIPFAFTRFPLLLDRHPYGILQRIPFVTV